MTSRGGEGGRERELHALMEPGKMVPHVLVAAIVASLPAAAAMWAVGVGFGVAVWVVGTVAIGAYSISSASRGRR